MKNPAGYLAKKTTVTIVYKSGAKVRVKVKTLSVKFNGEGTLTEVNWDSMKPRALHLGINEIAAVFQGKV